MEKACISKRKRLKEVYRKRFISLLMAGVAVFAMMLLSSFLIMDEAQAAKAPETIMRANCASCHGELGEGGYPSWIDPSQESMRIAGRSKSSIKKWVRDGRPPEMPAFPDQEINGTESNDGVDELDALATYVNCLPGCFIPNPTHQAEVFITDEDPWYNPSQLQVNTGDTVKFTNLGKTYHPVTSVEYVVSKGASGTDSGLLGPTLYGGGVYFHTFTTPGTSTFLCKIHPYMQGQVCVGGSCPTYPYATPNTPKNRPTVAGKAGSEIWVLAQFQDQGTGKDGVIQVIDASTISNPTPTITQIPVGNNPHNIWFNKDDSRAVVTNWFDNTVSVVNASTKSLDRDVIVGATNAHVTSDFAGNRIYVSVEGSHYIEALNPSRWTRVASDRIWITGYGPHGIWYGTNATEGGKLLTANSLDHTASVSSISSESELARMDAGILPLGAGMTSNGNKGYVGNALSGSVSVYDTTTTDGNPIQKLLDIDIGGIVVQPIVSPDDQYVVAADSPDITVISVANNTILTKFVGAGKGAHGVTYGQKSTDPAGVYSYAYVTHKFENYISVIDLNFSGTCPYPGTPAVANICHVGDVPLITPAGAKWSLFAAPLGKWVSTQTGGNGDAVRPLWTPWQ